MKLRNITFLVAISLTLTLFVELYYIFPVSSPFFFYRAIKTALQIPLILFFFSLWQRQRREDDQS